MFNWLNPKKEKNRVLAEISDDNGNWYVIDVPRGRTPNKVVDMLTEAKFERDPLPESGIGAGSKLIELGDRNPDSYRWIVDESVDKYEDFEANGDLEDDEISEYGEQPESRCWPNW